MTEILPHPRPIVIVGCTATGKSDLGEALAQHLHATVLSVDSMQVYRGMDIGTAKPDAATRAKIPHAMIDVADPWSPYSAARFAAEARPLLHNPEKPVVLVAGTILYLRALLEGLFEGPSADESIRARLEKESETLTIPGLHKRLATLDPVAASRIHPNDLRRIIRALEVYEITGQPISELQTQWAKDHPRIDATFIGVRREKEALNRRINARVKKMIELGLVEEVDRLRNDPRGFCEEAASGVGYRQLLDYFASKLTLDEAIEQLKIQTRYLAKMQRTWLKRFPGVHWLDLSDTQSASDLLPRALEIIHSPPPPTTTPETAHENPRD